MSVTAANLGEQLTIRSSRLTGENPDTDISGVYTGKWKDIEIGSTVVSVAKLSDKSFAAHWIEGGYAFSFMGENMKEKDFESLLSGYFIDVTEHVFGTDDASSIHHDMPF